VIRVRVNDGYWEVRPEGAHRCRVTCFLHFDPGGDLPGWAVELGQTRVLPETLRDLRKEVERRRETASALPDP
jgi:hypothetical protein